MLKQASIMATLAARERFREEYGRERDSIFGDRMLSRTQTFRHLVQPLPGQRILELGCGRGVLTRHWTGSAAAGTRSRPSLSTRKRCGPRISQGRWSSCTASALPEGWEARRYDFVIATDLLDRRHCAEVLQAALDVLKPGGQVVFYESNPWNPVLKLRRADRPAVRGSATPGSC